MGGGGSFFQPPKSFSDFQRRVDPLFGNRSIEENLRNPGRAIGETFTEAEQRIPESLMRAGLGGAVQASGTPSSQEMKQRAAEERARMEAEAEAERARIAAEAERAKQAFLTGLRGRRRAARLTEGGKLGKAGLLGR